MKKLPEAKYSCRRLVEFIRSVSQCKILEFAIKNTLFDYLVKPSDAAEVAKSAGLNARNTELLLNILAGMGLINKKNGYYSNTNESAEFLFSGSSCYMGVCLLHMKDWSESLNLDGKLENLMKFGPSPQPLKVDISNGEIWAKSARLSAAYHYCGSARRVAEIIAGQPEFPAMKKMLDLGGGAGFYSMEIISAHPSLEGVIFEQPPVARVTRDFLEEYEADDRISIMEGNYVNDPIGGSYDLIFASATLNFVIDKMDFMVEKVYKALNPGGLFITHQDGITDERTRPAEYLSEFLAAELQGTDLAIRQGMIAESMSKIGFVSVNSDTIVNDYGPMDITIGKKRPL